MSVPDNPDADSLAWFLQESDPNVPRLSSRWHRCIHTYTTKELERIVRAAEGNTSVRTISVQIPITGDDRIESDSEEEMDDASMQAERFATERVAALIGSFRRDCVRELQVWERNHVPIPMNAVDQMLDAFSQGPTTTGLKHLRLACPCTVPALDRFFERFPGLATLQLGHGRWAFQIDDAFARSMAGHIAACPALTSFRYYLRGPDEAVSQLLDAAFTYRGSDTSTGDSAPHGPSVRVCGFPNDENVNALLWEVRRRCSPEVGATVERLVVTSLRVPYSEDGGYLDVEPFLVSLQPLSPTLKTLALEGCLFPGPGRVGANPAGAFDSITTLELRECNFKYDLSLSAQAEFLSELLSRVPNLGALHVTGRRNQDGVVCDAGLGMNSEEGLASLVTAMKFHLPLLRHLEVSFGGSDRHSYPSFVELLKLSRGSISLSCRRTSGEENRDHICVGLESLDASVRHLTLRFFKCGMDGTDLGLYVRSMIRNKSLGLKVLHLDTMEAWEGLAEAGTALKELLVASRTLEELRLERVACEDVVRPVFEALMQNRSLERLHVGLAERSCRRCCEFLSHDLVQVLTQSLRSNPVLQDVTGVKWSARARARYSSTPEGEELAQLLEWNQHLKSFAERRGLVRLPLSAWPLLLAGLSRLRKTLAIFRFLRAKPGIAVRDLVPPEET